MSECPKPQKRVKGVRKPLRSQGRKCKICHTRHFGYGDCCSIKCAIQKVEQDKAKKAITRDTVKSLTDWLGEAQAVVNAYVRERDKELPCISCGRFHTGQYHAGHFRTVKAAPQLRFNLHNLNKQCSACNNHLSGNITEYRINLVKKIGREEVESLERNNEAAGWTIDKAKEIKALYKLKLKELQKRD